MGRLFLTLTLVLVSCAPKIQKPVVVHQKPKKQHVLVTHLGHNPFIITDTFVQQIHFSDTNYRAYIISDTALLPLTRLKTKNSSMQLQVSLATFLELEVPNCLQTVLDLNDSFNRRSTIYFNQQDSILSIYRRRNGATSDSQKIQSINLNAVCTDPMKIIYDVLQSTFLKSMHCTIAPNPVEGAFKFKYDCDLSPNFMPNGLKVEFIDNFNRPLAAAIMKPGEWRTFDFPKNMNGQQMIFFRILFLQTAYRGEFMKTAN